MSVVIGLGVGSAFVRAVAVRRGTVAWHGTEAIGSDFASALRALLEKAPRPRLGRARVIAAMGPALSQTKPLTSIPAVRNARLLNQLVRENAGRFFMRNGVPPATTAIHRGNDGAIWCAAMDAHVLEEIAAACVALRLRFVGAVPGAIAAGRGLVDPSYIWLDGDIAVDVIAPGGAPQTVRRRRAEADDAKPTAGPALASIGENAFEFADAFGAAISGKRAPLLWLPADQTAQRTRRWVRPLLAACVVVSAAAALTASGIRARLDAERARRTLGGAQATIKEMARLDHELGATTSAIARIERFAGERRSITRMLSEIAQSIPESTAILSLRADTIGGTLVTLSRRAADIVPQLREVSAIQGSQIFGAAMRETQGTAALERATIRFTFVRQTPARAKARP